jgi:O-methyltransferase
MIRSSLQRFFNAMGFEVRRRRGVGTSLKLPEDASPADAFIIQQISSYTMTSVDRQLALIQAVRHITAHRIPGSLVECGVWKGGSAMAMALTLIDEGDVQRDLRLYDTFEGMPPPQDIDRTADGTLAQTHLDRDPNREAWTWAVAGMEEVRQNMGSTGYPLERITYIKGPIETTIPAESPTGQIALLRLDTDWYASTRHGLEHLFPLIATGGILIIDDYGHWEGARKATDEYLAKLGDCFYLHRVDYTGRLLIKQKS